MLWVVGGIAALCGALAYAELAAALPRSGGEYNFLSRIYSRGIGFIAGWVSATVGFAAPVALAAMALGQYFAGVVPGAPALTVGLVTVWIVGLVHLSGAEIGSRQFAQARESFDAASALAPDDLDIRTNLALAAALEGQENKAIDVARSVVTSPGAQARHRRNLMIVYGLLGLVDEGRAAAPKGLSANEAKKLLARATAIRAISDAKARAKALGTIMS